MKNNILTLTTIRYYWGRPHTRAEIDRACEEVEALGMVICQAMDMDLCYCTYLEVYNLTKELPAHISVSDGFKFKNNPTL